MKAGLTGEALSGISFIRTNSVQSYFNSGSVPFFVDKIYFQDLLPKAAAEGRLGGSIG